MTVCLFALLINAWRDCDEEEEEMRCDSSKCDEEDFITLHF